MRPTRGSTAENRRESRQSVGCLPHGLPQADLMSYAPFKIIQTPTVIALLYELDNNFRQIYIDGRKLPMDLHPTWGGYSVGRWEGDTLVVDVAGFTDRGWLDSAGHPHSEALHIQERFHRRDSATWTSRSRSTIPRCTQSRLP